MWWLWASSALAWGPEAHRSIAERAEAALSDEARAALAEVTDVPLADLSTELDDLRHTPAWRWSRPLHFVNTDPAEVDLTPQCDGHLCATDGVAHFAHRLATSTDPAERREALMVVVHLVADVHQPLHVSYARDRGGNDHTVWLDGEQTDLHTVWDDVVPLLPGALEPVAVAAGGHPDDWAAESYALTRQVVYAAPADAPLDETYVQHAVPVVAQRTSQAAARLAEVLEAALTGQPLAFPDPVGADGYDRRLAWMPDRWLRAALVPVGVLMVLVVGLLRWRRRQQAGETPGYRAARDLLAEPGLVVGAASAILLTVAADVLTPLGSRYAFDVVVPEPSTARIIALCVLLFGALACTGVGWLLAARMLSSLAARFQHRTRMRMLDRLQGASLEQVRSFGVPDLLLRFQSDLERFDTFLLRDLPKLLRSGLQAVGLLAVMVALEWRVTLLTVVCMPLVFLGPHRLARHARRARHVRQAAASEAGLVLQEVVEGLPTLRAFGLQAHWRRRFDARAQALFQAERAHGRLSVWIPGSGITSGHVLTGVLLLAAVLLAVRGDLTPGDVVAIFSAMVLLTAGLARGTSALPALADVQAAYARIVEVLDLSPAEVTADVDEPRPLTGGITFEGVSFSHSGDQLHLDRVDIHLPVGTATAVVGRSGAGKSTLLSVLLQHGVPTAGRVMWDDAELHLGHRRAMGLVPQQCPVFALTVRENIRLGDLSASDAQVEAAARQAALHEAIEALPSGYDTVLGTRDQGLSGGQRQRLAIARALVRDPALLVLDEATSALDPATARKVRETLDAARGSHTLLTVTHDLASVRDYDQIVVLEAGKVADAGDHATLMGRCELYRMLVEQQSGFELDTGGHVARVSAERLARFPLFAGLPPLLLEPLAAGAVSETWRDGETVVRLGDPADRALLVVRGRLRVEDARGRAINTCEAGDLVGELALLHNTVRTATLVAQGHCVLLSITRAAFEALLDCHPGVRERVLRVARQRMENSVGRGVA